MKAWNQFSTEHIAVLALMAIAIVVADHARRAGCPPACSRWRSAARSSIEYGANALDGTWDWGFNLPLHLSDVVAMFAPIALWTRKPLLVEILYFWALTASLQAVLTPDLNQTFPSVFYFTYFVTHCGAVVAACLLVFGLRDAAAAGSGVARVRRDAGDGRRGRHRERDHRRQLHVPARQAGAGLAAGPDGPVAALHRDRGRAGARPVRAAGAARAARQP